VAANSITRTALYARISTSNNGQSPEMQLRELREYCNHRDWIVVGEYVDEGISGAKEKRPELDRLMSDAHRRRFDAILVWKLDRFGRSLRHLVNALAELEARGVAFVSLRDNLDLSTPAGRLMFQIIGAMAEFERALIAERVSKVWTAHKHQFCSHRDWADATGPHSALRTSSLSFMPNAHASAWATSIPMLTFPSSTELIYVR